jgi:hypothetical protein
VDNDKVFAAWALALIASVASVLTATVVAGVATLPSPMMFGEHLLMAFGVRAAYKSFGGVTWPLWLAELLAEHEAAEAPAEVEVEGAAADAIA